MILSMDWQTIGVLAAAVAAVAATAISYRAVRGQRRAEARLRGEIAALGRDVAVLCSSACLAGDRLVSVEKRSRDILARQERIDTTGSGPASSPGYRHALALLERGANAEELVNTCGLARGEAELVTYLHEASRDSMSNIN